MPDPKYKTVSSQFAKLIAEINVGMDVEDVAIKLAKAVNSIKKVDKTDK